MRLLFVAFLALTGCYGRLPDGTGLRVDAKAYGLDDSRPALIVFGALWCKPCVSEIPLLNQAVRDVGRDVQIVGFLVEGAQKGVSAAAKDMAEFRSPKGVRPEYRIGADQDWRLFDSLQPASGRALPTMIFVRRDHTVARVVQRSMHYESELLPALRSLAAGGDLKPPVTEKPRPQPVGKLITQGYADWSSAPGHAEGTAMHENVRSAWRRGLEDFAFPEEEMPFDTVKMKVLAFADGSSKPISGVWVAHATGCRLTVYFNADGSYNYAEGICR